MSLLRLSRVELTRYRSRRAIAFLVVVSLVLTAVIAAVLIFQTRPFDRADIQRAEQQAAAEAEQPYIQRELRRCVNRPRTYGIRPDNPDVQQRCEEFVLPTAEWYLYRPELRPREQLQGGALGVATMLVMALILAATTFAGADWNSGSLINQLLAVPGRVRLWVAKALPVTVVSTAVTLVTLAGWWTAVLVTARLRDIGVGGPLLADIGWQIVRAGALAGFAALGAYALTMLLRSTVATLGVLFAYTVVGDLVLNLLPFDGQRYAISTNVFAWLNGSFTYYDYDRCLGAVGRCQEAVTITQADAVPVLVVLVAVVIGLSLLTFRRRDV
ncbi:ABC transporter permease [Nocardioidaceae bacterium]|nr:ABC transporter permease [Nocardioidaceae bacterium]